MISLSNLKEVNSSPNPLGYSTYSPSLPLYQNTKKTNFLNDPDVSRWYFDCSRGSLETADVYQRKLRLFCELNGTSPCHLLDLDSIQLRNIILDSITHFELKEKPAVIFRVSLNLSSHG